MTALEYKIFYRRHLPHIQPPGAMLFITFRLAGSIPAAVQAELLAEAEATERRLAQISNPQERTRQAYREQLRSFGRWDRFLDTNPAGPHWLHQPEIAQIVVEALHHRHGRVYDLDTFCLMSNHGHVIFTPLEKEDGIYYALPAIMQSLKRYTAWQANEVLGRRGQFWQHESYDHVVRNAAELDRIRRYVLNNPVKAGLVETWDKWPWSFCKFL